MIKLYLYDRYNKLSKLVELYNKKIARNNLGDYMEKLNKDEIFTIAKSMETTKDYNNFVNSLSKFIKDKNSTKIVNNEQGASMTKYQRDIGEKAFFNTRKKEQEQAENASNANITYNNVTIAQANTMQKIKEVPIKSPISIAKNSNEAKNAFQNILVNSLLSASKKKEQFLQNWKSTLYDNYTKEQAKYLFGLIKQIGAEKMAYFEIAGEIMLRIEYQSDKAIDNDYSRLTALLEDIAGVKAYNEPSEL